MHIIEILESFNSSLQVNWETDNNQLNGYFSVDDRDYKIEIFNTDISFFNADFKNLIECSFKGKNKDRQQYTFFGTKTQSAFHSSQVFGTIINSVKDKINFDDKSILYFTAKNNDGSFESRKKMYQTLSRILSKKNDLQLEIKTTSQYELYLLSKLKISNEDIEKLLVLIFEIDN